MSCSGFTGWNIHQIMENWGKSQTLDLYQQLYAGVRFLDLRIGINRQDGQWKVHHGMVYGEDLEFSFGMIQQFLEENPSEIVVIGVSHVEHFRMSHLQDLFDMLDFYFADYSGSPFEGWMGERIEDLVFRGQRLFFIVSHLEIEELKKLKKLIWVNYEGQFLYNTYANKDTMDDMKVFNEKQIKKFKWYVNENEKDEVKKFDEKSVKSVNKNRKKEENINSEVKHHHSKLQLDFKKPNISQSDFEISENRGTHIKKFEFKNKCKFATQKTIKEIYKNKQKVRIQQIRRRKENWLGDKDQLYRGDNIYLMSWTLTPGVKTIMKSFLPFMKNSLENLSKGNFDEFLEFIRKKKLKYSYPIMGNVLIFDFVTEEVADEVLIELLDLQFDDYQS